MTDFPRSHLRIVPPTPAPYDWQQDPDLATEAHGPTPLERQGWPHDVNPNDILDCLFDILDERD